MSEADMPPFLTSGSRTLSSEPPPPPSFDDEQSTRPGGPNYSMEALKSIMASPLSSHDPMSDGSPFGSDRFEDHLAEENGQGGFDDKKAGDFLAQARRAAKAAAELEAERSAGKGGASMLGRDGAPGRGIGRLMIIALAGVAVVAGIVAVLFTLPGSKSDEGVERPDPGASIGEILNGPTAPAVPAGSEPSIPAATPPTAAFEALPPPPSVGEATGAPTSMV
jgi:hypothetical protein